MAKATPITKTTSSDLWLLECTTGKSNKFYEITINSVMGGQPFAVMTRHGRIGSPGRVIEYDRASTIDKARYLVQELMNTKLDKGYKLVRQSKTEVMKPVIPDEQSRFSKIEVE